MPTEKQFEALRLYGRLMHEAKARIYCIGVALTGHLDLPTPAIREFCYLQFRMLCELIALACLTAHGDIAEATPLTKEYAADKIVGRLEELHPGFYPCPIKRTKGAEATSPEQILDGFLTKQDLISLYRKCGNALHRGSLKKLLASYSQDKSDFEDFAQWGQKIHTLLYDHTIDLVNGHQMICTLENPDDDGKVQAGFLMLIDEAGNVEVW